MDRPPYDTTNEMPADSIGFNVMFLRSFNSIIKISEMIASIVIFIVVSIPYGWSSLSSGGWLNFVAAITLIFTAIFFIFYLFDLMKRLKGPWVVIEFVSRVISLLFWFIAFIVAATHHTFARGSAIAAAIFSVVAAVLYAVELGLRFRVRWEAKTLVVSTKDVQRVVTSDAGKPPGTGGMPIMSDPHYHGAPYPADPSSVPQTTFSGDAPSGAYTSGTRTDQGYMMP